MLHFWDASTIALANNVDNLGARIAYSIRGVTISISINVWIAVITFVISSCAALSGSFAADVAGIVVAPTVAMVLLVVLGLWMIVEPWKRKRQPGNAADAEGRTASCQKGTSPHRTKRVGLKEGTVLGVALSINNIGGGISAGMMRIDPYLVGLLSAVVSFIALWAGNYFAAVFVRWHIADKAGMIGGALMIALGIRQVVG